MTIVGRQTLRVIRGKPPPCVGELRCVRNMRMVFAEVSQDDVV